LHPEPGSYTIPLELDVLPAFLWIRHQPLDVSWELTDIAQRYLSRSLVVGLPNHPKPNLGRSDFTRLCGRHSATPVEWILFFFFPLVELNSRFDCCFVLDFLDAVSVCVMGDFWGDNRVNM
jgi:hypothetical protein